MLELKGVERKESPKPQETPKEQTPENKSKPGNPPNDTPRSLNKTVIKNYNPKQTARESVDSKDKGEQSQKPGKFRLTLLT